jgi:cell division protein FtsI/penicillin-binding protein 2
MSRVKIIQIVFVVSLVLIILRLFYWQVIKSDELSALADLQRITTREVVAPRGDILFSDGSILASSEPIFLVFAQPKLVADKVLVARELGKIYTEVEYSNVWKEREKTLVSAEEYLAFNKEKEDKQKELEAKLLEKLSSNLFWVSLNFNVNLAQKQSIEKMNFAGIGFDEKTRRFYPEGSSSAHLLGFIGADSYGSDKGYFGVEGYYEGELRGKNGQLVQERDAHGTPILIGKYNLRDSTPGKQLVLNIDRTMQFILENKLKIGIEKYQAKSVSGIVLDPKTGGVLAMASYPNYDPGSYRDFAKEFFRNPITVDGYEPGSTFKVLVMAAGINEGVVTPTTQCDICGSPLQMDKFTIRTWNNKYQTNATMTDVIVHSDNIGMVYVARKLGLEKFYDYMQKFGFDSPSGADVEDEYTPFLKPLDKWSEIDLATGSFGQGISVNAMQLIKAVASIANGGKLMEPHVVARVVDKNSTTEITPRVLGTPISADAAKQVTEMMVRAVEDGEAKFYKPKGYTVAGKTGTAQIPVAGHYDPNKTVASFVGFAPADDPKFVMLIRYEQPTKSIYGSETAAPTFFEIAKEYFNYLNIPPKY